ncbi:MAG: hypothetical protein E7376_02260 [Clostridiales bacterium]|nr:hypothetical protein [Clostridiales bacterium]
MKKEKILIEENTKEENVLKEIKDLNEKVNKYEKYITEMAKKYNLLVKYIEKLTPKINNAFEELSIVTKNYEDIKMDFVNKTENEHVCGKKSFNDGISTKGICICKTLSKEEKITETNIVKTYGFVANCKVDINEKTGKLEYVYSEDKFLKSSCVISDKKD